MTFPRAEEADIALLLEGTFPYVAGGVSSWVNQIIRGFPEYRFAIIFLGSRVEDYGDMKYALPDNVVHLERHFLYNPEVGAPIQPRHGDPQTFEKMANMHKYFRDPHAHCQYAGLFSQIVPEMGHNGKASLEQFLYSHESWEYIKAQYLQNCTDPSFVDYFWSIRSMHTPVWMLSRIAENFIPVKAYHTVSTGYAGLLGALLKAKRARPLILSEHGIYTKERKIDLFSAQWVKDNRNLFQQNPTEVSYFRQLWIRFFQAIGKQCYDQADHIVALFENNRLRQVEDGAPSERTCNIPNGIDVARFGALRSLRPEQTPQVMCLIGRVVPIKDIKTFVRAMRTVVNRLPQAEGWIAGPEDEDPSYVEECRQLVNALGLNDNVKFLGFQKLTELLPKVGLGVLSSVSEGLPLVILEGFAAGVPAVSTDVGSCKQLIFGLDEADQALGAAGDIVGIADPQALAYACLKFLTDQAAWNAASEAAIKRVETYYTQAQMFGSYRKIYQQAVQWQA